MAPATIRWLDPDTILVVDRIGTEIEPLRADEEASTAGMTRSRLREFAAGRALARYALERLHHRSPFGISVGHGGEPIWPSGYCGSLSHTGTHVAALVSRSYVSVGVDLDDARLLGSIAAADLMTREEVGMVLAQGWTQEVAIAQNIVFAAKEALFKYQYPLTRDRDMAFDEVQLAGVEDARELSAIYLGPDRILRQVMRKARIFFDEIQGLRTCWVVPRPEE
jgi:4'-phosphopantetheinyl transferase EntD